MRFYLTQDQLNFIQSNFKQQPTALEKWMDWSGLDMIDKFVEENNQRSIDFDDDHHIEQLNELYREVYRSLEQILCVK